MNRTKIKKRVRQLRSNGKTYTEIKKKLNLRIPKSTLSNWCHDIKLPQSYFVKVKELNIENLTKGRQTSLLNRKKQQELFLKRKREEAERSLNRLSLNYRYLKLILATLYLGEGAKWKGHRGLMLGSSDPKIILLYIELLNKCYGITKEQLKCRISYRADQNIKALEKYWAKTTGVRKENFYQTKPDPRTIGKKTLDSEYKGVCVITCRGTDIQLELEQIINALAKKITGL